MLAEDLLVRPTNITSVRLLRLEYPGTLYHLTSRGDRRESLYLDDKDRDDFLSVLASAGAVLIDAYTLTA
jgi:hypothetical protein